MKCSFDFSIQERIQEVIFLFIFLSTVIIYIVSLTFQRFDFVTSSSSILISLLICTIYYTKSQKNKIASNKLIWIFCFIYLSGIAYVISPLAISQNVNGMEFLRYVGIGDYYKHSYTITSILETGVPPKHPYYPDINFSYYYGYYLLPAAISTLIPIPTNSILLVYIIITSLLSLSLTQTVIWNTIRNQALRFVSFFSVIFGTSLDIIPMFFVDKLKVNHIENWMTQVGNGQAVENIYSSLVWTPQHFLASVICVYLVYLLYKNKFSVLFFVLSFVYVTSSSIFVAIVLSFWMLLLLVILPSARKKIIICGLFSAVLLAPFLLSLKVSSGLLYFYAFNPIPELILNFIPNILEFFLKLLLYLFIEHGPIFLMVFYAIYISRIDRIFKFSLILALIVPRIVTFFVRSPGVNDLSLKIIQPISISVPILFFFLVDRYWKSKKQVLIIVFVSLFIIISSFGNLFEVYNLWKNRKVYSFEESTLYKELKKLPRGYRLLAIDRDEWVFRIPILSNKVVMSASPFDSNVYIAEKPSLNTQLSYEKARDLIFMDTRKEQGIENIVQKENQYLDQIYEYLDKYHADGIILNEKEWAKKGRNVWNEMFLQMEINVINRIPGYVIYDYENAMYKLKTHRIMLNRNNTEQYQIRNRQVFLKEGLYFIFSCSEKINQQVDLEFERYFTVFSEKLEQPNTCLGKVFYNTETENVEVSTKTTIDKFYAIPITISPKL